MSEQAWMVEARARIGVEENKDEATLKQWVGKLGQPWFAKIFNRTVPWCGVFVAHCLNEAGLPYPKTYMRAKDWATYGVALSAPVPGCIVVFEREGGGHVAFLDSVGVNGRLNCLGGNQKDRVEIDPFKTDRVIAYRYPAGVPLPSGSAKIIDLKKADSTNEA